MRRLAEEAYRTKFNTVVGKKGFSIQTGVRVKWGQKLASNDAHADYVNRAERTRNWPPNQQIEASRLMRERIRGSRPLKSTQTGNSRRLNSFQHSKSPQTASLKLASGKPVRAANLQALQSSERPWQQHAEPNFYPKIDGSVVYTLCYSILHYNQWSDICVSFVGREAF